MKTGRDNKILLFLWPGLTPQIDIDCHFFTDADINSSHNLRSKITQQKMQKKLAIETDLAQLWSACDNVIRAYNDNQFQGVKTLFESISLKSGNKIIAKSLSFIINHCNFSNQGKSTLDDQSRREQATTIQGQIKTMLSNLERELWLDLDKLRQRDRRNKVMRRLIKRGYVKKMPLPRELASQYGGAAYYLSSHGVSIITQTNNISPDLIRSYNFNAHTAAHEINVAKCIRSIFKNRRKYNYIIASFMDEPKIRKLFRSHSIKPKAFPDLCLNYQIGDKNQTFWLEIDMGTMPTEKIIALTRLKLPVIIICADNRVAHRRRTQMIDSLHVGEIQRLFFITTVDRFANSGILSAGYLTAQRGEFCQCKRLVMEIQTKKVRDELGCPCILRYFTEPKVKPDENRPAVNPPKLSVNRSRPQPHNQPRSSQAECVKFSDFFEYELMWAKRIGLTIAVIVLLLYVFRYEIEFAWLKTVEFIVHHMPWLVHLYFWLFALDKG